MHDEIHIPLPHKCHRCGGTHDEMFPDIYCWEETFRMYFGFEKSVAFELDPQLKEIHDRIVKKHNHMIDILFDEIKQDRKMKEAANDKN